mmetsp:Transcript_61775/g.139833  ORF Transcript_61775/g.139833 Transcript_61775/m.139833 type:complete len:214 (+) Transcript_61775:534-1175(+)
MEARAVASVAPGAAPPLFLGLGARVVEAAERQERRGRQQSAERPDGAPGRTQGGRVRRLPARIIPQAGAWFPAHIGGGGVAGTAAFRGGEVGEDLGGRELGSRRARGARGVEERLTERGVPVRGQQRRSRAERDVPGHAEAQADPAREQRLDRHRPPPLRGPAGRHQARARGEAAEEQAAQEPLLGGPAAGALGVDLPRPEVGEEHPERDARA